MNQTLFTPLSLSQLLKSRGVKQESMFYWWNGKIGMIAGRKDYSLYRYGECRDMYNGYRFEDEEKENSFSAFTISELPDVFRQVFDNKEIKEKINGEEGYYQSKAESNWDFFCSKYFKDPKTAWETLEKTIRSL